MVEIIPHVVAIDGYGWIVKYLCRYLKLYEKKRGAINVCSYKEF